MRPSHFVRRSLSHHAAHHAPGVVGAAIAGAVILASLYVGDSVKGGLEDLTRARQSGIAVQVEAHAGPMGAHLVDGLSADLGRPALPVWRIQGGLSSRDGALELQDVQLFGVDARFWNALGEAPPPEGVHRLNRAIIEAAERTGVAIDDLVFRGRPLSSLPTDTPLSGAVEELTPLPIWGSAYYGAGSRIGRPQVAREPMNVFVPLSWLQERLKLGTTVTDIWLPGSPEESAKLAHRAELSLMKHLEPRDVGLSLVEEGQGVAIRSDAILLPKTIGRRAQGLRFARAHLTWFVDEVSAKGRSAPFTFATALEAPDDSRVADLQEGEVLVNEWLAEDLSLSAGDSITLRYHRATDAIDGRSKGEATLRVAAVLPMNGLGADRSLTPPFPGLSAAKRCQDWDPGVEVDGSRIRARDEQYWQLHGAAPKLILPLETGQRLWRSRFGDLNEVILEEHDARAVASTLLATTTPAQFGLQVRDLPAETHMAEGPATDFGTLFLGFSFVLVLAALVLSGMLFGLSIERRSQEIQTLRRVGLPDSRVHDLYRREALALALAAVVVAALLGPVLASWTLETLEAIWPEAVGGVEVSVRWTWHSAALGMLSSLLLIFLAQRRAVGTALKTTEAGSRDERRWVTDRAALGIFGASLGGLAALFIGPTQAPPDAAFFTLGTGFMLSGFAGVRKILTQLPSARPWSGLLPLTLRGAQRNPGRSLAVIASLALASFLVVGVGAYAPSTAGEGEVSGASGGFEFIVETSTGVPADVRQAYGRARIGLLEEELEGISLWPVRVKDGEDASCLSPGQASRPRILGVDASALEGRRAFEALGGQDIGELWGSLQSRTSRGAIPIVGDEATLRWGLGLGAGDLHEDVSETGETITFEVVGVLARSFLQGAVLTSEHHLAELYPKSSETRMVLVDAAPERASDARGIMKSALADRGARVTPTSDRLAEFAQVETSYIRIFLAFGLLGLLLGAAGVAVLLSRNALARKREFAVLRALGQPRSQVWLSLTMEHCALVATGLALGTIAAYVGLWPTIANRSLEAPTLALGALGAIAALSFALTSAVAWRCVQDEPAETLSGAA